MKYKVITKTDFGTPGREAVIGRHKTFATAGRQYPRLWELYGRRPYHSSHLVQPKVWQELNHDAIQADNP